MGNNDLLVNAPENKNYDGKMKSVVFIVRRGSVQKKIFKWLFAPNNIDFYISFPYFKSETYYCGTVSVPQSPANGFLFNAVKNGIASKEPVKFSYHSDGQVHSKPTKQNSQNLSYKLAEIKVKPLDQREGSRIFRITFEGLDRFEELKIHKSINGNQEVILDVPKDIIHFDIQAFAGSSQESLEGQVKKRSIPWFQLKGLTTKGNPVFIGIYTIVSRRSYIVDSNKNGLHVLVGFDDTDVMDSGKIKSLYLWAR